MADDIVAILKPLVFIGIVVLYVLFKRRINRKHADRVLEDGEYLAQLALKRKCSEYDLFHECGGEWHLPAVRIEEDFKMYLRTHHLPHYVRDCIRKVRAEQDGPNPPPYNPGGKLPPSWSA